MYKAPIFLALTYICSHVGIAYAHHSEAAYNHDTVATIQGTVDRVTWRNPHVYIYVNTTNEAGQTEEWKVETGSIPMMARSGWSPDTIVTGESISIQGYPENRPEIKEAIMLSLEKDDGSTLAQKDILNLPEIAAEGFSGIWKRRAGDGSTFTKDLEALKLSEAGLAAQSAYDIERDNPLAACTGFPAPRLLDTTGYLFEIEELDDRMVIYSEYLDSHRTIYTDGRDHPEDGERSNQGHSIAHWEDDVLVVDTQLFADHRSPNRNGVPSGSQKHVIEKYRLSDDKTHMFIDVFMEDPEYLSEAFEGQIIRYYSPTLERHDYNCEPEEPAA
jgi:hypothetical protein